MRTVLATLAALVVTPALVLVLALARLFRVPHRPDGIYDHIPAWWSRAILWSAGVRLRVHGDSHVNASEPRIFACNHASWFDVLAVAAVVPGAKFVAKAELLRVPIFGHGMRIVGMIGIERENRKAAFAAYEVAAARIRSGTSVVVFPEGTRGFAYDLRPFKKGPFVLAIAAGVPMVPVVIHGTIEIMKKRSLLVRAGAIDLHFLAPVPTTGYTYDERDRLLKIVHDRMAAVLHEVYGVAGSRPVPALSATG